LNEKNSVPRQIDLIGRWTKYPWIYQARSTAVLQTTENGSFVVPTPVQRHSKANETESYAKLLFSFLLV